MQKNNDNRLLLIIIDGLGFNPTTSKKIIVKVWDNLSSIEKSELLYLYNKNNLDENLYLAPLYPISSEVFDENHTLDFMNNNLEKIVNIRSEFPKSLLNKINKKIYDISEEYKYVPWASKCDNLAEIRNNNYSIPTKASGIWVGYEDIKPTVQGNSETGHQQIGNLSLASQIPLEISESIKNKSFYENSNLNSCINKAIQNNTKINFSFLLSGTKGSNGRVHSAWNHLEAFLKLVFIQHKLPPEKLQMQAILDGRDSGNFSSVKNSDEEEGFLYKLKNLLEKYKAIESLCWIVGRSSAMDRDFREEAAYSDFMHLTGKKFQPAKSVSDVISFIKSCHLSGTNDQSIPPISILRNNKKVPIIDTNDSFINLNFRSDRQRIKTAWLSDSKKYLLNEAKNRGKNWKADWLEHGLKLNICTIAEYDPYFEEKSHVKVAYKTEPLDDNLLYQWKSLTQNKTYALIGESVKASHVGYFIRGRREKIEDTVEYRKIIPSHSVSDGVNSDTDFFLFPEMRNNEITDEVISTIESTGHNLIICNLASTDMIGHCMPEKYEEAKIAYKSVEKSIRSMLEAAKAKNIPIIITSDHGNIEDLDSSHSANEILTTIILNKKTKLSHFPARLYDIGPTILEIFGIKNPTKNKLNRDKKFLGKSIITLLN
ncbi:MAG: alkaline phosphatase family protein [Dehalococcoidia bacterium]